MKLKRVFTPHISISKLILAQQIIVYRVIVAIGFVIVIVLALAIPAQMNGASPRAYYYGVQNFSQGKLVLNDQLHLQLVREAM